MYGNKDSASFVPAGSFIDLSEQSSNLSTLTWMGDGRIRVVFQKGGVYDYAHCPPSLWDALLEGSTTVDGKTDFSIGAAFRQEVINKSDLYPFTRIVE